jgi:predicted ester cyclase
MEVIMADIETVWSEGDTGLVDNYVAEDFVGHMIGETDIHGSEGYKDWVRTTYEAFPDTHVEFTETFFGDDVLAAVWMFTGTHEGEYPGFPIEPTGRRVEMEGLVIGRMGDEKMTEFWHLSDTATMLDQLGVFES